MKLSVDFRCYLWGALLFLVVSCMVTAENNSSVTIADPGKSNASLVNATTPSPKVEANTTTASVTVPANSTNATTPAPATTPTSTAHPTTKTTQGPAVTNSSTTTVTSKDPTKPTNATSTSASPVTSSVSATLQQRSGFDLGSFIGGIVLTLGLLAAAYFGCRFYSSKRGVRYRTIDEHEAII